MFSGREENRFDEEQSPQPQPSRAAKPGQTFTTWIMQFRGVDDLLGDLANDIARDPKFPATGNLASYTAYLEQAGARLACLEAFEEAWDCFESRREPGQFFGVDTVTCANCASQQARVSSSSPTTPCIVCSSPLPTKPATGTPVLACHRDERGRRMIYT